MAEVINWYYQVPKSILSKKIIKTWIENLKVVMKKVVILFKKFTIENFVSISTVILPTKSQIILRWIMSCWFHNRTHFVGNVNGGNWVKMRRVWDWNEMGPREPQARYNAHDGVADVVMLTARTNLASLTWWEVTGSTHHNVIFRIYFITPCVE